MLPTTIRRRVPRAWADPFDQVERELNNVLNRFMPYEDAENGERYGAYPVDIREDEDHLYIEAELPGFTKDDVDITIDQGVLTITAERKVDEQPKGTSHLHERRYTKVSRRFSLPTTVDDSDVEAKLTDGVLHLTLAKSEDVKPRKITVS